MYDCIYFTDIGKKLVAKTFSLAGTLYESCNINEFDRCRSYLFCMIKLTELSPDELSELERNYRAFTKEHRY